MFNNSFRVEYYFSLSMKEVTFHPGNPQSKLQPLCIKRINLVIQSSSKPRYESFLDELFGYFHPRTLVVKVNSDSREHDFIQVLCNIIYNDFILHLNNFPSSLMFMNLKVLMNELEGWNRDGTKRYKRSEYMSWFGELKRFTILGSPTITRQEREARCSKPVLCAGSGKGPDQKRLLVDLPNISTVTSQEREARGAGSREGLEQQCVLYVALPNLSTITREGAHQINLELEWYVIFS